MTRAIRTLVPVLLAVVLAGCGGDESSAEPPRLEPAVAERLAAESEAVADALDSSDICAAAAAASNLHAAAGRGEVPPAIRREIRRIVDLKAPGVNCDGAPPPPPATTPEEEDEDEDDDHGKDKKEKKDKKHGHEDEEEGD